MSSMCYCNNYNALQLTVWSAGHAAVGRAAVAGQHHPDGARASGLDAGWPLPYGDGTWRALADEPHGL